MAVAILDYMPVTIRRLGRRPILFAAKPDDQLKQYRYPHSLLLLLV